MTNSARRAFYLTCALAALPALTFGDTLYSDNIFAPANWLPNAFVNITNDPSGPDQSNIAISTGPQQCASCGFGGSSALTLTTTATAQGTADETNSYLNIGFINNAFTWNPATQGALWMVSGTLEEADSNTLAPGEPDGDQFDILIQQGGNYYVAPGAFIENGSVFNLLTQSPVGASNFNGVNGTPFSSHPISPPAAPR